MRGALLLLMAALAQAAPIHPAPPSAREIAPDTWLLPGGWLPDRGPDGNTVIAIGRTGLVVIDTGRHSWQSDGILAFARDRHLSVAAIVNTHWHLDHSSGNGRVKAAHPAARVYTTSAVEHALAPGGFLTRNLIAARERPAETSAIRREEVDLFVATMAASETLRPDVAIEQPGTRSLAGRPFSMRIAGNAVTDADLWLYDQATGVAVIGDLVTLPAPFLETACPARWQDALDEVWATPFRLAVPGHGDPMTRADFDVYRGAFAAFRSCAGGDAAPVTCAAAWMNDIGSLLRTDADRRQATDYAAYYVDFLRKNAGASPDCRAK